MENGVQGYRRKDLIRLRTGGSSKSHFGMIIFIILGLILFWDVVGPFGLWKLHRMKHERKRLYLANIELAKVNASLEQQIKRLKDDSKYQEYVIRRKLGWVRDNEVLYRFLKKEDR